MFNLKYDHPILVQILKLYVGLTRDGKEIVFIWVLGHVGIGTLLLQMPSMAASWMSSSPSQT